MTNSSEPRSLYVHVPFCAHRCGYCNFTLVAGRDDLARPYVQAVTLELESLGRVHEVETLYYGGGTPTQLPPDELNTLCRQTLLRRPLAVGGEWTVEANPLDVSEELVGTLRSHGVTRISLGAQSFNAEKLKSLERDHGAEDIRRAADAIRSAGMQLAVDLIFAAPGETLPEWRRELRAAIDLQPDHISTYGLTYERGAAFWGRLQRSQLVEAEEELQREMYLAAIDSLTSDGMEHYEVSNFAKPNRRSRHNEAYWSGAPYEAVGPGAARFVDGVRSVNHRSTTTYLKRVLRGDSPIAESEMLSPEAAARELLVFGLRRLEGVDRDWFQDATGYAIDTMAGEPIERLVDLGLLENAGRRIRLTRPGLLVSDALWPELL